MAEYPLRTRRVDVPADQWDDEHYELAESAMRQGLPQPTRASWTVIDTYVDDVDGAPLMCDQARVAHVGNC